MICTSRSRLPYGGLTVIPLTIVPEWTLITNRQENEASDGVRIGGKDCASGERDF